MKKKSPGARKSAGKKTARAAKARATAATTGKRAPAKATAANPREGKPAEKKKSAPVGVVRTGFGPAFMLTVKRMAQHFVAPAVRRPARRARPTLPDVPGVEIKGAVRPSDHAILTELALQFLADLHRRFEGRRQELMAMREARQARFDEGELPDFLRETVMIRAGRWKVAPIPHDLQDRRVEITGPVDRKMIVNALNSGANVFMADFEDANSPTWRNNLDGQINLRDRWHGSINFTDEASGKRYALGRRPAVLIVRPRGLHLLEEHMLVDGAPIAGALFDFGLYFFHNARAMLEKGTAPYFYLPKLESHLEARFWNDVFVFAQQTLAIAQGTIRATVLIETLPAAFEMEEILFELRDHVAGLNAGRWDYIFSFIKKFAKNPHFVLPDRDQVVMGKAFLGAYADLLVKTCHKRGAFAMGGMAAQIPIKGDKAANEKAFAKVRADKEREAREGYDGTWVAHPALVPVAKEVFDRLMPTPNQLDKKRADVNVTRDMLLQVHEGTRTEAGFRMNIRVGVQYLAAWLGGRGAVPIYNLMEDAATAEISRAQIWQWIRYGVTLDTGVKCSEEFFERALNEEMEKVKREVGARVFASGRFADAIRLFRDISLAEEFVPFLTIPAYRLIV